MMISPESYYEFNLKGKSVKELEDEIKSLKKAIAEDKELLENPLTEEKELIICPGPDTRIAVSRDYLAMAIKAFTEAGGIYKPNEIELRDNAFQSKIGLISKITYKSMSYFDGEITYTIGIENDSVDLYKHESLTGKTEILSCEYEKEALLELIESLHIGEWDEEYTPLKWGIGVLDGEEWNLTIEYCDGSEPVTLSGDNVYPYNFDRLSELFEEAIPMFAGPGVPQNAKYEDAPKVAAQLLEMVKSMPLGSKTTTTILMSKLMPDKDFESEYDMIDLDNRLYEAALAEGLLLDKSAYDNMVVGIPSVVPFVIKKA